jgi:hypothetical protein
MNYNLSSEDIKDIQKLLEKNQSDYFSIILEKNDNVWEEVGGNMDDITNENINKYIDNLVIIIDNFGNYIIQNKNGIIDGVCGNTNTQPIVVLLVKTFYTPDLLNYKIYSPTILSPINLKAQINYEDEPEPILDDNDNIKVGDRIINLGKYGQKQKEKLFKGVKNMIDTNCNLNEFETACVNSNSFKLFSQSS